MKSFAGQKIKSDEIHSSDGFKEIDFNEKKKEAKKILRHQETLEYALETLRIVRQIHKQVLRKMYLYRKGNLEFKNSILKDLELIQNNYLERSKFPKIPDVGELEALEAIIFPIKNLCFQLQAGLESEAVDKEEGKLEEEPLKYESLSKLLQEEQDTLDKETFFKDFLNGLKKEFADKNPQPRGVYFAYAWPSERWKEKERWVQNFLKILKQHLEIAGITTVQLDIVSNRYGSNIYEYMEGAQQNEYVLLFGTESLKEKHEGGLSAVCTELIHILRKREKDRAVPKVFPILLSGNTREAFPVEYERYITITDWCQKGYLLGFQELYLELLNLAPERHLAKVNEIWNKILAHLPTENSVKVQKKISEYESGRKQLPAVVSSSKRKTISKLILSSIILALATLLYVAIPSPPLPSKIFIKGIHPDFTGRQKYLGELDRILFKKTSHNLPVAVLWGEGGVGKSETAIAFANIYLRNFSLVYWIESDIEEAYDQGYRDLAKVLKITFDEKEPAKETRRKVHYYLEHEKFARPWLLIFDNAERVLDLPSRGNGRVIITSRTQGLWHSYSNVHIPPFNEKEALELFRKIVHKEETAERRLLIKELGCFPLILN